MKYIWKFRIMMACVWVLMILIAISWSNATSQFVPVIWVVAIFILWTCAELFIYNSKNIDFYPEMSPKITDTSKIKTSKHTKQSSFKPPSEDDIQNVFGIRKKTPQKYS